jgi:hypothetical protein
MGEIMKRPLILVAGAALALCACQTKPVIREVTVTKEVLVPYHQPCPETGGKPDKPKRLAEEAPAMPADPVLRERLLAGKVFELSNYADQADAVMTECGRQR